jgi:hypothetical protein
LKTSNSLTKAALFSLSMAILAFAAASEALAQAPELHGKWRGDCATHRDGKEITISSRIKIVQYGTLELKVDGQRYRVGEKSIVRKNLLGAGRVFVETECSYLTAEQASRFPPPFSGNSQGGFICSTEGIIAVRGWNHNLGSKTILAMILGTDGTLSLLEGEQDLPEKAKFCRYRKER